MQTTPSRLQIMMLAVLSLLGMTTIHAADFHPDSVQLRMARQLYEYPQEKIHVTTDQSRYVAGDTVWLRVWVVDAATHEQVTASRFVYLELSNPFGEVSNRIKLRQQDGIFSGYIPLDEEMAEGDYILTAYTSFMQGPGKDYFFRKPLKVTSPFASQAKIKTEYERDGDDLRIIASFLSTSSLPIHHEVATLTTRDGKEYKSNPGKKEVSYRLSPDRQKGGVALLRFDNYRKFITLPAMNGEEGTDVQFFPEGGYLVPDAVCMVGIKAIDRSGRGVDVSGVIQDSKGNTVAEFTTLHRGMGVVSFKPQRGETYTATVGGETYLVGSTNSEAATLHVDNMKSGYSTVVASGKVPPGSSIVVLNRGRVQYAGYIEPDTRMQFPRENLGEGVIQYLLIDGKGNRLSERLSFGNYADSTAFTAQAERNEGQMTLTLSLPEGMEGDVAVSVLDRSRMAQADTTTNIEAQLLLQSDLRGYVEDPGYYFRHKDRKSRLALDALLMTQGWTRYDVPSAIRGSYSEPTSAIEIGTEFSGKVKSLWKGKPLANARITAIGPKSGFIGEAKTDKEGNFVMTGPDFPEGTKFIFQAFNKKGKNEMNFDVDAESFPEVTPIPGARAMLSNDGAVETEDSEPGDAGMWVLTRKNGMMSISLADVTITRTRKKPKDIYEALSHKSFNIEDFKKDEITSYEEVLRKIAGIQINHGDVIYRGNPVIFFVDNMVWESSIGSDEQSMFSDIGYTARRTRNQQHDYMGDRIMKLSKAAMSQTTSLSRLSEFESQYPFHTIKRIEFLQPGAALVVSQSAGFAGALVLMTKTGVDYDKEWEQPPHLQLKDPLGYQQPKAFYVPKYNPDTDYDFGSTIYWNPCVLVHKNTELEITVPKSNTPVSVNIEGFDAYSTTIHQSIEK